MITRKSTPIKHRVCSIDFFPYVIFSTYEEAQKYSLQDNQIRKVRINVNKKNLNIYYNEMK